MDSQLLAPYSQHGTTSGSRNRGLCAHVAGLPCPVRVCALQVVTDGFLRASNLLQNYRLGEVVATALPNTRRYESSP